MVKLRDLKKSKKTKTVVISSRYPQDVAEMIVALAEKCGNTPSCYVARLVENAIEKGVLP